MKIAAIGYLYHERIRSLKGGGSGIGLATAKTFLEKGAKVVIADYDEEAGRKAEENLKSHGDVLFKLTDVSVEEDIKKVVALAVEKFGHLDIMFNNAGIGVQGETHKLSYEDYQKVIKVNQDSVFYDLCI